MHWASFCFWKKQDGQAFFEDCQFFSGSVSGGLHICLHIWSHLVLPVSDLGVSFSTVTDKTVWTLDVDTVLLFFDGALCLPAHKEAPIQGINGCESLGHLAGEHWMCCRELPQAEDNVQPVSLLPQEAHQTAIGKAEVNFCFLGKLKAFKVEFFATV